MAMSMNIELSRLNDDRILLMSDRPMPDLVKRIEYYRDQRMFMIVWHDERLDDLMMRHEVPIDFAIAIEKAPNILVYSLYPDGQPMGYHAPLIKVGDIF